MLGGGGGDGGGCARLSSSPFLYTWDTGTQSHEGDGSDRVPKAHGAAKMRRQVAYDGGQRPDHQDGNGERDVTVVDV